MTESFCHSSSESDAETVKVQELLLLRAKNPPCLCQDVALLLLPMTKLLLGSYTTPSSDWGCTEGRGKGGREEGVGKAQLESCSNQGWSLDTSLNVVIEWC